MVLLSSIQNRQPNKVRPRDPYTHSSDFFFPYSNNTDRKNSMTNERLQCAEELRVSSERNVNVNPSDVKASNPR